MNNFQSGDKLERFIVLRHNLYVLLAVIRSTVLWYFIVVAPKIEGENNNIGINDGKTKKLFVIKVGLGGPVKQNKIVSI